MVVVDRPGETLSRWQRSPGVAGGVAGDVCDDETLAAAARLAGSRLAVQGFLATGAAGSIVAFLASPLSAAINGAVIAADRGLSTTFLPTAPGAADRQPGTNSARE